MAYLQIEKRENDRDFPYQLSIKDLDTSYEYDRTIFNLQFIIRDEEGIDRKEDIHIYCKSLAERIVSIEENGDNNFLIRINKTTDDSLNLIKFYCKKVVYDKQKEEENINAVFISLYKPIIQWEDIDELDRKIIQQAPITVKGLNIEIKQEPEEGHDKNAAMEVLDSSTRNFKWRLINLDTSYERQNRYIELEYAINPNKDHIKPSEEIPEDLTWIKLAGFYGNKNTPLNFEELMTMEGQETTLEDIVYSNRIYSNVQTAPGIDNDYYITELEYALSNQEVAFRATVYYYYKYNDEEGEYVAGWFSKSFLYDEYIWLPVIAPNIISDANEISSYKAFYPPILEPTQPAFVADKTNHYKIYFSLSDLTNFDDIGHIGFIINKLEDGSSIVHQGYNPDQVIYKSLDEIHKVGDNKYYVEINNVVDIANKWQAGNYYKVQARLGLSDLTWRDMGLDTFSNWKAAQVNSGAFSEWSTVMVLKAIDEPIVSILNDKTNTSGSTLQFSYLYDDKTVSTVAAENSQSPVFVGAYKCKDQTEWVEEYRFILYQDNIKLEDSGWRGHDKSSNEVDSSTDRHTFKTLLNYDQIYTVIYMVRTNNLYEAQAEYTFTVYWNKKDNSYTGNLYGFPNEEEGTIELYLSASPSDDKTPEGTFIVLRTEADKNNWDDIGIITFTNSRTYDKIKIFDDFLIEYGKKYRYALQYYDITNDRRGQTLITSGVSWCYFEHSYLYRNGKQLKIKYDPKVNSFKHTVLEQKQDTLGKKHPVILRNGYSYYAELPIGGLITLQSDQNQNFIKINEIFENDRHLYPQILDYNKQYESVKNSVLERIDFSKKINTEKSDEIRQYLKGIPYDEDWEISSWQAPEFYLPSYEIFSTDLTSENIYMEKLFRDKAEEFLNDGNCKLLKTPTEGNFIVSLLQVQLQPRAELGRMIYDFSATAYEIDDNTIPNLKKYKIIDYDIYKQQNKINRNEYVQISGVFSPGNNLLNLAAKELNNKNENVEYKVNYTKAFWVEPMPQAHIDELSEDESNKSLIEAIKNGLKKSFEISVNGTTIKVGKTQIYYLEDLKPTDIEEVKVKSGYPCVYNCLLDTTQTYGKKISAKSAVMVEIYGQIQIPLSNETEDAENETEDAGNKIFDSVLDQLNKYKIGNKFVKTDDETYKYYAISDKGNCNCFMNSLSFNYQGTEGDIIQLGTSNIRIGLTNQYTIENWEPESFDVIQQSNDALINYKAVCILEKERENY